MLPEHIKSPKLVCNASGVFEVRYSEKKGGNYRSRVLSCRTTCRDEAESFFQGWMTQVASAEQAVSTQKVRGLCDLYSSFLESGDKGGTQTICVEHIARELGDYFPADLKPHVINDYKRRRGVAQATLRRELGVLRAILSYAIRHNYLEKAPTIDLPAATEPRKIYLRADQERDFHRIAMEYSNGLPRLSRISRFVAIGLCTGQRKQAIESLTWDRVDLIAGRMDFRMPGKAQSNKRQSVVPISKRLMPILQRAYHERTSNFVLDNDGSIKSAWRTLMATPEMKPYADMGMHIHAMRKTFCTLSIHAGVSPADVAACVGDSVEVILRHYLAEMPQAKAAAVNARF